MHRCVGLHMPLVVDGLVVGVLAVVVDLAAGSFPAPFPSHPQGACGSEGRGPAAGHWRWVAPAEQRRANFAFSVDDDVLSFSVYIRGTRNSRLNLYLVLTIQLWL